MEPLFTYTRAGFAFMVYSNRIDITENKGLFQKPQTRSILLRNITSVEKDGIGGHLKIATSDGKTERVLIGPRVDEARTAIVNAL